MVSLMSSWEVGNWVKAVAFSPDATRIAVTTDIGNSARICDTYTGLKLVGPLEGHTEVISAFAFSPDGRTLASGSGDATVRLWDTETGTAIVGPLSGHINWINSVTFSLDGRFVVSAASDKTIRIWDAHTGETARGPIRPGHHWAQYLAPVSGGRLAISGHAGYVFTVYDMDSCTALFECAGHESSVQSISCSPDGRLLASASADHTVRIWDAASGIQIGQPLEGHLAQATLAKFSPDSRYIVSSSAYDSVRIWDVKTREMYGEPLPNHKVSVVDATFTPDGNRLVSAYWQGIVKIWDVRSLGILTETANTESGMTAKALETQVTRVNLPTKQAVSQFEAQDIVDVTNQPRIEANTEAEITSATTPEDVVSYLSLRGCANMTDALDLATCSERPISSGGFGDIYQGNLKDGTQVAIKTIRLYVGSSEQDQKILKHAAHEVYAWSKCKHPNVQPLLGLATLHGYIGMIARWESNGSLPHYLERHPDADRCTMGIQIADGLSYLHASGVVHGDLKGANVLISQDGVAQLADFGNAKLQEYTLKFTKTSTKEALSSRWAAPELFEGKPCSYATDVYALGMTILEAVTGDVPWIDKSERAVLFAITMKKAFPERPETFISPTSEHGDTLWSLLKSCWEFEPEERPSAADVAKAMRAVTQNGLKPR